MASDGSAKGKKRSKAFYRKSAYGGKRQCTGRNVLEPGIRGFLVMCHSNESSAVRESYNILNEYADLLYGPEKPTTEQKAVSEQGSESEDDGEDIEKALKKEVDGLKNITPIEKRFQNVATKAKNIVFIRTTLQDTVKVVTTVMEDIATRKLSRARYAARMLPIVGTCKAQTAAIAELAKTTLSTYFLENNPKVPTSFTIMFKARNNNGTTCGKESVIPAVKNEILNINPRLNFSWSDYEVAVIVEIVCNTCCLSLAPGYIRLRKYNFQELSNGPRAELAQKDEHANQNGVQGLSQGALSENKSVLEKGIQNSLTHKEDGESSVCGSERVLQMVDEDRIKKLSDNDVSTFELAKTEAENNFCSSTEPNPDAALDSSTLDEQQSPSPNTQICPCDDTNAETNESNTGLAQNLVA